MISARQTNLLKFVSKSCSNLSFWGSRGVAGVVQGGSRGLIKSLDVLSSANPFKADQTSKTQENIVFSEVLEIF